MVHKAASVVSTAGARFGAAQEKVVHAGGLPKYGALEHGRSALESPAERKVSILGTGSACQDLLSALPGGIEIVAFADNDPARHGCTINGVEVVSV